MAGGWKHGQAGRQPLHPPFICYGPSDEKQGRNGQGSWDAEQMLGSWPLARDGQGWESTSSKWCHLWAEPRLPVSVLCLLC